LKEIIFVDTEGTEIRVSEETFIISVDK